MSSAHVISLAMESLIAATHIISSVTAKLILFFLAVSVILNSTMHINEEEYARSGPDYKSSGTDESHTHMGTSGNALAVKMLKKP